MVYLVSAWAEAYMDDHPEAVLSVTGGGTRSGIAAFLNQTTDIIAASRDLQPEELQAMQAKALVPEKVIVAFDGIAVIVHKNNPIETLMLAELKAIFTGKVRNWQELGGENQPILIYSRESSSGTYQFFREKVLNKADYSVHARLMPATSGILAAVASDVGSIGYVGLGHAESENIKIVQIKVSEGQPAIKPTRKTIQSGEYPIARPLYLLIRQDSQNPAVHDFVQFALSDQGQHIVAENGYIPL